MSQESLEKSGKLLAREVMEIQTRLNAKARGLMIKLKETETEKLTELKKILDEYKGNMPLYFNVRLKNPARTVCLKTSWSHGVDLSAPFLERIQKTFGRKQIQLC